LSTLLASTQSQNKETFITKSEPDSQAKKRQKFGTFTKTDKSVSTGYGEFSGKGSIPYSIEDKTLDIH